MKELYEKVFIDHLFAELMESSTKFHEELKDLDMSLKVDLVKAATKNYFKLTKKFLNENIFTDVKKTLDDPL